MLIGSPAATSMVPNSSSAGSVPVSPPVSPPPSSLEHALATRASTATVATTVSQGRRFMKPPFLSRFETGALVSHPEPRGQSLHRTSLPVHTRARRSRDARGEARPANLHACGRAARIRRARASMPSRSPSDEAGHEGAAHDHTVGEPGSPRRACSGVPMPTPTSSGRLGERPQRGHQLPGGGAERVAGARDAVGRHAIHEATGRGADRGEPVRRSPGSGQEDAVDIACRAGTLEVIRPRRRADRARSCPPRPRPLPRRGTRRRRVGARCSRRS